MTTIRWKCVLKSSPVCFLTDSKWIIWTFNKSKYEINLVTNTGWTRLTLFQCRSVSFPLFSALTIYYISIFTCHVYIYFCHIIQCVVCDHNYLLIHLSETFLFNCSQTVFNILSVYVRLSRSSIFWSVCVHCLTTTGTCCWSSFTRHDITLTGHHYWPIKEM